MRKLRQNTQKIAIFCVITAKYTVNCQFFALNLKKFTPAKKNLHENEVCSYIDTPINLILSVSEPGISDT